MLRLTLDKYQPTFIKVTICIYKLVHDEYFNLWDVSNQVLRWNNDFRANYIILDWLYFIGL